MRDIKKKDIYIIRNSVNDMVYIGQTNNMTLRWQQHISNAKHDVNFPLYVAMRELGVKKFYYQIIEEDVENYDEREKYWIRYYNSIIPNGYNTMCDTYDHPSSIFDSMEQVQEVIYDIVHTKMSFESIAKKYGCCVSVISEINLGHTYHDASLQYPLRISRYTKEQIKQITYSLKYEHDKSISDIAKEYGVDCSQVSEMNRGVLHPLPNTKYPIRRGKVANPVYDHIDDIIDLLQNSDMQQKDIAKQFNVSVSVISGINKGRSYRKEGITYPIRKNYQCGNGARKCFSPDEVREIEYYLQHTDKGIREIAKEYECSTTTIMNMNIGSIIKYRNKDLKYPLRKSYLKPVSTNCV